ncbi:MAG: F0F1 ATP synthase subunit B [Clostridiales bacterium]|nr:F0F1 ATP synthase subunit B [Clostridiales bacterium]
MNLFSLAALTGTSEAVSQVGLKLGLVEPNWTFVFQIANTLILFLILKKLLFKPVTEFMAKRQEGIENSLKDAENKNLEAEELIAQYHEKINQSKSEGMEIIRLMTKEAEGHGASIVKAAEAEAEKIKNHAILEIEREREKAINSLKEEVSEMILMTASKLIEKDLNDEDHKILIKKFIGEVGDSKWQN